MTTITHPVNRYRTMSVHCWNFPKELDLHSLTFKGYLKHVGVSKTKSLTIWNFDTLSYLKTTSEGFIHAVGLIGSESYQVVLM